MTDTGERDSRALMMEYIARQLIGPWDGEEERLQERPQARYLTGILFPQEAEAGEDPDLTADIDDDAVGPSSDEGDEDPLALAQQQLPSSVGVSFMLPRWGPVLVEVRAARYEPEGDDWRRRAMPLAGDSAVTLVAPTDGTRRTREKIYDGAASVEAVWRPFGDGALVTVVLVNRRRIAQGGKVDVADCLFQVALRCRAAEGLVGRYPTPFHVSTGQEGEEFALLYRNVPTFAIGHGCAATWSASNSHGVVWVETTYMPRHVTSRVDFELPGAEDVLSLAVLAGIADSRDQVLRRLHGFVDGYDAWADRLEKSITEVDTSLQAAAHRLLERVQDARRRMRAGIALLEEDAVVREAFALANKAMLMQMIHSRAPFARRRAWTDPLPDAPDYEDRKRYWCWRPFQLAFLLLTMESLTADSCPDREIVDLIWFPTGGGKTEAYLGAMAFTIFYRRLTRGDLGSGVTVMTRYTLRLLTAQQFQRAATLACACELIRSGNEDRMGSTPVSIGIWVGGANSPNSYADAVRLLEQIREREQTTTSFQLELCPWCGTELLPSGDAPANAWGVHAANDAFRFMCPNQGCQFRDSLPISSVDEDLYNRPPTILIGTVDKFARLAWEARAGVFLGSGDTPGPSLIVQDEFHLISGPLGTIVGLYEAAFDAAMATHGARPKILASTATIRRALEQSRGVFGREVALFPSAGLDADDSYFVRFDHSRPDRLYVGVMPQGHTPLTAMVHLSAALLQAPVEEPLESPYDDAYWTLVVYHNSLRELGKTVTLAHDDIPARIKVIASAEDSERQLSDDDILELTSNIPAADIPRNLERLTTPKGQPGAVAFAASTNMISVGVDVPRLGLMLVAGQPKTTAEYVQATSRVGRSAGGIVVTLYSPSKPRDRSHYESFVPYHSALYRYVEPTSVTPFSIPARQRALHAALVILARSARGWASNEDAASFDPVDPVWGQVLEEFLHRVAAADPDECHAVRSHLEQLEAEWGDLRRRAESQGGLRYRAYGRQQVGLLRRYSERGPGWPTLDSMRNIDVEVRMAVRGAD